MVLKIIYAMSALEMLSLGMFLPSFRPYLISVGFTNITIGILGSLCALIQLIGNPIAGSLSDTKGRKPILFRALILNLISLILLTLNRSIFGVFIARTVSAISGQTFVLLKALVADNVPSEQQSAVYGKIGGFAGLGFLIGPAIGGYILGLKDGFFYLTMLISLIVTCNIVLSLMLPDEKSRSTSRSSNSFLQTAKTEISKILQNFKIIKSDVYWDIFSLKFLVETSIKISFSSLSIVLMEKYLLSQKQMGMTLSLVGLINIVSSITMSKLKDKLYHTDVTEARISFDCLLVLFFTLLFMLIPIFWVYMLCFISFAFSRVLLDITWTKSLLSRTSNEDKGVVMGTYESMVPLSDLLAPLLSGILLDIYGTNAPTILATVPIFIGLLLCRKVMNIAKKRE